MAVFKNKSPERCAVLGHGLLIFYNNKWTNAIFTLVKLYNTGDGHFERL